MNSSNQIPCSNVSMTKKERFEITRNKFKRGTFIILMIIVPLVNFAVFYVYVNFNAILQAFIDPVSGGFTLDHFKQIFIDFSYQDQYGLSPMFVYLGNTMMYFGCSLLIMMPLTTIIAYFIYKKIFMYKFFRVMFFMPSILSSVVLGMLYKWLWSANSTTPGPLLDITIRLFDLSPTETDLWANKDVARWLILAYCIWTGFGTNLILMTGAMARIPEDVLEAAQLDGVSSSREVVSIIIPLIWPTLTTLIVMAFTGIFTASGPLLIFDKDNKANTSTLSYYIFYNTQRGQQFNYTTAVGLFFTIIGMPIILGVKKIMERCQDAIEY